MKGELIFIIIMLFSSLVIAVVADEFAGAEREEFEKDWDTCETFKDTGDMNKLYIRCLDENRINVGETRDEYADSEMNSDKGMLIFLSLILGFVLTALIYAVRGERK